ncbi:metal-sensing transcriptional repressor [Siminovitchia terrae]|uniref:Transcriptional regulator n=1 Tax=Siminovitchia terrae TaxID=1914933 RepID=A0A429X6Y3_SIMTE|nr:metal-sensing transcriptional repressor [Siminovitchia terrae]RST59149.1 transcriptional regulator [Siminovitchia terrae]GIN90295.1 copper-sensing transcriptional repressor CsoR [Siminovitchia terrae]
MSESLRHVHRNPDEKKMLQNRLKRIEGQVRGIQKMVDDDRYCADILIQLTAVSSALKQVGLTLLEKHTHHCVADAIKSGDGDDAIEELMKIVNQLVKT